MKVSGFGILPRIVKYKSCWTKILVNIGIIFSKKNSLGIKYQLYTRSKPRSQCPSRGIQIALIYNKNFLIETVIADYHSLFTVHCLIVYTLDASSKQVASMQAITVACNSDTIIVPNFVYLCPHFSALQICHFPYIRFPRQIRATVFNLCSNINESWAGLFSIPY